jgi:hypothetical protein
LTASGRTGLGIPSCDCFFGKPQRKASALTQSTFEGTSVVYALSKHYPAPNMFAADYLIDFERVTWPERMRATRLRRQQRGKRPHHLPHTSARHQVLVVFGPEVSPRQAVKELKRVMKNIEKDGLLTGSNEIGDLVWEPV